MELPKPRTEKDKDNYKIKIYEKNERIGLIDLLINIDKIELVKAYSEYNFNKMILQK